MKSRWIYPSDGSEPYQVGEDYVVPRHANAQHNIIPDIQPYKSMIDGSMITSRSKHREHLKAHGCVEVGNDSSVLNPKYKKPEPPPGLKRTLIEIANAKLR